MGPVLVHPAQAAPRPPRQRNRRRRFVPVRPYKMSRYVRSLCPRRKLRRARCAAPAACGGPYPANQRLSR